MLKKLASLKRWLTLEDAANYLSLIFDEAVSKNDLIQLALEGHLTLSVIFPNPITTVLYQETPEESRTQRILTGDVKDSPDALLERLDLFARASWSLSVDQRLFEPDFQKEHWATGLWDFPVIERTVNPLILGEKMQAAISNIPLDDEKQEPSSTLGPIVLQHTETGDYWGLISYKEIPGDEDTSGWKRRDFFNKHHSLPATATIVISQPQLRAFVDSVSDVGHNITSSESDSEATELRRTQRTLAALAAGLASKYPAYKNGKKPNASQLAKLATEHLRDVTSDRTPHGFSETTARLAIAEALKACPDLTET